MISDIAPSRVIIPHGCIQGDIIFHHRTRYVDMYMAFSRASSNLVTPLRGQAYKRLNVARMSTVLTKEQLTLPETRALEKKFASLRLTGAPQPLKLGTALNNLERRDVTPALGTEFSRGAQLAELLKASNSDAILRDLAILSACPVLWAYSFFLLTVRSISAWRRIFSWPR